MESRRLEGQGTAPLGRGLGAGVRIPGIGGVVEDGASPDSFREHPIREMRIAWLPCRMDLRRQARLKATTKSLV